MASATTEGKCARPTFIDLFAGCGGFSLGFCRAGWQGIFAVERDAAAFKTFSLNFLGTASRNSFVWPDWLPKGPFDIRRVIRDHREDLTKLRGSIDAIIGGPPCQGFSFAGTRKRTDSRNQLFRAYIDFVDLVRPRFVLIENVRGITIEHGKKARLQRRRGRPAIPYSQRIVEALRAPKYSVCEPQLIQAAEFGVPQRRPRVFFFAYRSDSVTTLPFDFFKMLHESRSSFLQERSLPVTRPVHVEEAISDLLFEHGSVSCDDEWSPKGFKQGLYGSRDTDYQSLLRKGHRSGDAAQSHRFSNHRADTVDRFKKIQAQCRKGVQLDARDRKEFELSKHVTVPLRGDQVGHTLTTLPDDYIHYAEPRILTVREYARLQSFPDDFEFEGPFTSGGDRRKKTCPRYTQIGNAVPPLLGEALGLAMIKVRSSHDGVSAE
ncbi:MAG: DNA cytosine methyltransferase [Deltaproteobacteria bacterium]|nr:DNA cytosine methyltransferase [Deltaproteobacteria bacterium]